jgi:hypothetical protein
MNPRTLILIGLLLPRVPMLARAHFRMAITLSCGEFEVGGDDLCESQDP